MAVNDQSSHPKLFLLCNTPGCFRRSTKSKSTPVQGSVRRVRRSKIMNYLSLHRRSQRRLFWEGGTRVLTSWQLRSASHSELWISRRLLQISREWCAIWIGGKSGFCKQRCSGTICLTRKQLSFDCGTRHRKLLCFQIESKRVIKYRFRVPGAGVQGKNDGMNCRWSGLRNVTFTMDFAPAFNPQQAPRFQHNPIQFFRSAHGEGTLYIPFTDVLGYYLL